MVTFITGNRRKAEHMAKYLNFPVRHQKLELDEPQSLEPETIVRHKAKQAYRSAKSAVLVEDVSLTFHALGRLPGPFIKWFEQELGLDGICKLLDAYDDRSATAAVTFAYYDGKLMRIFKGEAKGKITNAPRTGPHDFGWNPIFVPAGRDKTYAEMDEGEIERFGLRPSTVFPQLKDFLETLDTGEA